MNLIRLATERRVGIAMVTILLVLFGLIGLSRLKVNLLPDLSYPTLTVRTEYVGAAPAEIENLISEPLEEALGTVKNLTRLRSVSRTGQSDVILEFAWGTDMDSASMDVREKLELIQLPLEVKKPLLLRFDPSTEPVLRLALDVGDEQASQSQLTELRRYAEEDLKKRLEPIEGVAAVKVSGGLEDEIQVEIDQNRLKQLSLDVNIVIERLRAENINISSGRLDEASQRYLVRTINQFATLAEMGEMIVSTAGVPVKLKDVATISQGHKERQAVIRSDGREAVEVAVYKEGDANTVSVAEAVLKGVERLKDELPEKARLTTVDDQSLFIKSSIREVVDAAVIGGLLSILVIFLFLGEAWATLVIALSLPVSIIATFFFMQQFGIGLNVMSLGGIALATGMVVDNAIVVLENVRRLRDTGLGVIEAAVKGTSEVGMAITASTFTHIAVFLPLVFVEGIAGQLFGDQALTVTFAMIISLFVAVTLIPMLASLGETRTTMSYEHPPLEPARTRHWLMSNRPRLDRGRFLLLPLWALLAVLRGVSAALKWLAFGLAWLLQRLFRMLARVCGVLLNPLARATMAFFDASLRLYDRLLPFSLRNPALVLGTALATLALAVALLSRLGVELIPEFAQGRLQVDIKLPVGTPLARTDALIAGLQQHSEGVDDIRHVFATAGTGARLDANPTESGENIGKLLLTLAPHTPRSAEPAIVEALRAYTDALPGAESKFSRPQLFSFDTPLEIEIAGYDLALLKQASERIAARMREEAIFADVKNSQEQGAPEVRIYFDQERIAALGMTTRQVADQVVRKVRGEVATRYSFRDRKIDVLVRASETDRDSVDAVRRLIVNPGSPTPVPLDSVARIDITEGPAEIRRVDQERVAVISASLRGDLGAAVQVAQAIVDENLLPAGTQARVAGQSEDLDQSFRSLLLALGLAVFLVYLVMASQFESLLHPFLILFTIPLALVGAVFSLWLTGTTLSIIVFIGLIMLVGIVVSNAIVLIDRVNQLRARGMDKRAALVEGSRTRLRPIVMTTITTLFGFLPMALGLGDGAELRQPLAITVIGGLAFSTLLTLVVIPVLYDVVDRRAHFRQPRALEQGAEEAA